MLSSFFEKPGMIAWRVKRLHRIAKERLMRSRQLYQQDVFDPSLSEAVKIALLRQKQRSAEHLLRKATELARKLPDKRLLITGLQELGYCLKEQHRNGDAEKILWQAFELSFLSGLHNQEETREIKRELDALTVQKLYEAREKLKCSWDLRLNKDHVTADRYLDGAIATAKLIFGPDHWCVADLLADAADPTHIGVERARALLNEASAIMRGWPEVWEGRIQKKIEDQEEFCNCCED